MRFVIATLLLSAILYSKSINYKLVVSADKNITKIEKHLLKLNNYFRDNEQNSVVMEKYKLSFRIEKLGDFNLLTIKPIDLAYKNELLILLNPIFQDVFSIEDKIIEKIEMVDEIIDTISEDFDMEEIEITEELEEDIEIEDIEINNTEVIKDTKIIEKKRPLTKEKTEKSWLNDFGLEWIGIFLLASIGLISSIYSRRKLLRLEKKQKNLTSDQDKIESEIQNLGVEEDV